MALDPVETRVLGALLEKQRTTPDGYPLSLNSLRHACNQATNRDPVVDYDEATIRKALGALGRRRWIRSGGGLGGRTLKYRHLIESELDLGADQLALLAVLMLRGPQTPGELKQRTERLHPFADLVAVHATLDRLIERELAARLPRRPGQKEERYEHRLGGEPEGELEGDDDAASVTVLRPASFGAAAAPAVAAEPADARPVDARPAEGPKPLERIEQLERELAELRERLAALEAERAGG